MAQIQPYLDQINEARYGKDVRSSIVNGLEAMNNESEHTVERMDIAEQKINTAITKATTATNNANTATETAYQAIEEANTATNNANEAAQAVFDEKYILTARTEFAKSATVQPTAKGNALIESIKGDSYQRQLTGKNLLDCRKVSKLVSHGVTFNPVFSDDGALLYIETSGTAENYVFMSAISCTLPVGSYILTGCPKGGNVNTGFSILADIDGSGNYISDNGNGVNFTLTVETTITVLPARSVTGTNMDNLKFYPMIVKATEKDLTYEPYCGGTPSPNPEFPQEIESVGDDGGINVRIIGKNLLNIFAKTQIAYDKYDT